MNAVTTMITECRNAILPTVTVGRIKTRRTGEIVLVYLNEGETNSFVLRYDQLSRRERSVIRTIARDPLRILKQK